MKTANWLDSSAVLALLYQEPGSETVRAALDEAENGQRKVFLSAISLAELVCSLSKNVGDDAARDDLRLILELPVEIRAPNRDEWIQAGWLRARHKISTADAIIAAQAMAAQAELIHKDPELDAIPELKQRRLPYKPSKR